MTPLLLSKIIEELWPQLDGSLVSSVHQPDDKTVLLRLMTRRGQRTLLVSTHPLFSRLNLFTEKRENPATPPRFCALLRSRIEGLRITEIRQKPDERIAKIALGDNAFTLVMELTGKSSNIILLDNKGVIVDALRIFAPETSVRAVMPGITLAALPKQEILKESAPKIEPADNETWNEAVEKYFSAAEEKERFLTLKKKLLGAISGAAKHAKRKLENRLNDKTAANKDLLSSKTGDIISANLHKLKKGMHEALLADIYSDTNNEVLVKLDPTLSASENAAKYYKRAKKAATALKLLERSIPEVEAEILKLENLTKECAAINTEKDALTLEKKLIAAGYMKKEETPGVRKKEASLPIRQEKTSDGFTLLIGKSSKGNDLLIKEYASDEDLWFHAKGIAGAHVVLKSKGRAKPPSEKAIHEAAVTAASSSKASASTKLEVICASVRHVKKPKGAKPGMVTVTEYKTLIVKPDRAQIKSKK
ncbi:MAG: NFACT family protein [Deltaproteobacteria bacterium]|nr:NFACT family protein [Deltaproteobacteria bacterium]